MKVTNIFRYTLGVILLTLHVVSWILVFADGFTIINITRLLLTFILGTHDILDSIEVEEENKNENNEC